jgi:6-phosphogluconolactonase
VVNAVQALWRRVGLALLLCGLTSIAGAAVNGGELVYFGTQASEAGQGIVAARFDAASGRLSSLGVVAEIVRPTWLVAHPRLPVLYSVSEVGDDTHAASVFSLAVDRDTGALRTLNQTSSGGGGPAHLAVDAGAQTLYVANYGTGQVGSLPVRADGSLGALAANLTHAGSGPSPRQTRPHAHAVVVDPSHRFLLAADLGADRIFIYRIDAATHGLSPAEPASTAVTAGAGPRHLAFHPNGRLAFLVTELSAQIHSYRWDARSGRLQHLQTLPTLAADFAGPRRAAEIAVSHDGRFVYVSNRGEDTIVSYAVEPRSGRLQERQRIDAQGKVPWAFAFDASGRWLLVANQGSNAINVFSVDPRTGRLATTQESLPVPRPVNVTFLPGKD